MNKKKVKELPSGKSGKYTKVGLKIGQLVDKKNVAYGDSFNQSHKVLEVLFPNRYTS